MTLRLTAVTLMAMLVGLPLTILPTPFLGALAAVALAVGGAGATAASVPLVTAGGALALIEYALALVVVARPDPDPVTGTALGAGLVLLLATSHFASITRGAAVGYPVIRSQARHWLAVVALGVVGAPVLTVGGEALAFVLRDAALPVVVALSAVGALMTVAGVIALVTIPRHDT